MILCQRGSIGDTSAKYLIEKLNIEVELRRNVLGKKLFSLVGFESQHCAVNE